MTPGGLKKAETSGREVRDSLKRGLMLDLTDLATDIELGDLGAC